VEVKQSFLGISGVSVCLIDGFLMMSCPINASENEIDVEDLRQLYLVSWAREASAREA
jgi:hypothetical protein